MQDIHAIGGVGGVGGRFLGGGDRRLRPHSHHQVLKCPRCDSLNTKFCYYNNYNLSQPRHFCKSCRRYWTKGGVLRNVPVGGGCRKSKRSKPKTDAVVGERKSNQSSSSESSSLTAATTAADLAVKGSAAAAEEGAVPRNTTSTSAVVYKFPDPSRFFDVNPPSLDRQLLDHHQSTDGQIFTTEMKSLTNLMTSPEEMMGFGSYQGPASENPGPGLVGTTGTVNEVRMQDMRGVSDDGFAAALDWGSGGGGGDQSFFDLTAAVDPGYWSPNQWTDNDQSLNYLP